MKQIPLLFLFLISTVIRLNAQTNQYPKYFIGTWNGEGEFASGKKISATLSFTLSLDSCWLVSEHADKAPNQYKATSMWGIDADGAFLAYTFDNFHGHRQFVSDGWKDGRLILSANDYHAKSGLQFQHFIYEKLSATSFKMTYEVSKDGIEWRLIDHLVFTK